MIEMDELLSGNPSWAEVADFFKNGEFFQEQYLVQAIKKHLLTEAQRKKLFDLNLSIEECLNGKYTMEQEASVMLIYREWNFRLGFHHFGS
jgi:hypothetical protein